MDSIKFDSSTVYTGRLEIQVNKNNEPVLEFIFGQNGFKGSRQIDNVKESETHFYYTENDMTDGSLIAITGALVNLAFEFKNVPKSIIDKN